MPDAATQEAAVACWTASYRALSTADAIVGGHADRRRGLLWMVAVFARFPGCLVVVTHDLGGRWALVGRRTSPHAAKAEVHEPAGVVSASTAIRLARRCYVELCPR